MLIRRALNSRAVTVGEVAILKDDTTKKIYWKLAVVEELISWQDIQIRAAIVRIIYCDSKPFRIHCSFKHLIPMIPIPLDTYWFRKAITPIGNHLIALDNYWFRQVT